MWPARRMSGSTTGLRPAPAGEPLRRVRPIWPRAPVAPEPSPSPGSATTSTPSGRTSGRTRDWSSSADGQVLTSSGSRTGFRLTPDRMSELRTGTRWWRAVLGCERRQGRAGRGRADRQDDGVFLGALGPRSTWTVSGRGWTSCRRTKSRKPLPDTEQGRVVASSAGTPPRR